MVKSGQMKIQQMAFMLMAVTLFFVLAGLFIMVIKFSGLKESATALEEKNAMLLATKLANSPEFSCGEAFDTQRTNCVDADKIIMLKNNIEKYKDFWGVTNIELRKIYPVEDEKICTTSNYPNCNLIQIQTGETSGYSTGNFVSLCRKENRGEGSYNKCELARLSVSYEEVK